MSDASKKSVKLFGETLDVSIADYGNGRPYLILHGGAGPGSVASLAVGLSKDSRAIVPTHPGFNGQPRPEWFSTIEHLTLAYLELLDSLDLRRVVIIGNSVGGWIAAEMALRNSPRISGMIILNGVGVEPRPTDKQIVDPATLPPQETLKLSFHDPARFALAPSGPDAAKIRAENQRTLRIYGGDHLVYDPTLRARLVTMPCPVLVLWGESDRIADKDYGRGYADSIRGARFQTIPEAGHFPQIEQPDKVLRFIKEFVPDSS
jgi:pimeloyl-ACP methyl ester carboxylesterase